MACWSTYINLVLQFFYYKIKINLITNVVCDSENTALLKGKEQEDLFSGGLSLPCHTSFDSHNLPLQHAVMRLFLSSHIKIFEASFIYLNHIPNET